MFSRFDRRASAFNFLGSVVLTAAFVILIYVASPLRDPTFQPNSANAGSLVPWLEFMGEQQWIQAATLFAVLLATNLTFLLYQLSVAGDRVDDHPYRRFPRSMEGHRCRSGLPPGFC
jgi:hypothetical protein